MGKVPARKGRDFLLHTAKIKIVVLNSMTRLVLLFLPLVACKSGVEQPQPKSEAGQALHAAVEYLWSGQEEDGGWHSPQHGLVRSGQAWTPFILNALLEVPDSIYLKSNGQVNRAARFITKRVDERGVLGLNDPDLLEYPNYSTAYAMMALMTIDQAKHGALIDKMGTYLTKEQFTEQRGFANSSLAYGSWGMGETNLLDGQFGHLDLSHTRRVLQALNAWGKADHSVFEDAQSFLRVLQKHPLATKPQPEMVSRDTVGHYYDGGFYFSTTALAANKGGSYIDSVTGETVFRSYATTTCDGLLSLLLSGYSETDEPVQAAIDWLVEHPRLDLPEGIPEDSPGEWDEVVVFYHYMVRAEVYSLIEWPGEWRSELVSILKSKQLEDGSFSNPKGGANKEDDPLLATAMAVMVLSRTL